MPALTAALRREYRTLYETCRVAAGREPAVDAAAAQIRRSGGRYEAAGAPLGIPWYVVGLIHALECGLRFDAHLHNGDPLAARTVHVPRGRPAAGAPPFAWEESARDALAYAGFAAWRDWSVAGILYRLEAYNGWGYRHHPECGHTPYLWSFSNHYRRGRYVGDGVFSPTAVSQQPGAGVLLKRLLAAECFTGSARVQIGDVRMGDGERAARQSAA